MSWADIVASGGPAEQPTSEEENAGSSSSWAAVVGQSFEDEDEEATQAPSTEVEVPQPTSEELDDLSLALGKIWEVGQKLEPGKDYELDLQGYATYRGTGDYARRPLFKNVKEEGAPAVIMTFMALLDNYKREAGQKESVTSIELSEQSRFLDMVLETPEMIYAHAYLVAKRKAPKDITKFKNFLGSLWFRLYASTSRGPLDSSGFEHVFVGEERAGTSGGQVTGLHNWIQLYRQEKMGFLNYCGYIAHNRQRPSEEQQVLSLQFLWRDADDGSVDKKPSSTCFIGTSPALELAIYTLTALCSESKDSHGKIIANFHLPDGISVDINCILWQLHGAPVLRTAYPST